MAQSPGAHHRARLIREMARDSSQTGQSDTNHGLAQDSTTWDPENEAFSSTSLLNTTSTTQRLPELRDSAKKYRTYTRPEEPTYEIDTSIMAKAFPDFTQGGIESDDSLELSRASNKGADTASQSGWSKDFIFDPPTHAADESVNSSKARFRDYQLTSEPPRKPVPASKKTERAGSEDLRKEAIVRRASVSPKENYTPFLPMSKTKDLGSEGSNNGSGEHRRPLAETQARVRDENDCSQISDDRPDTITLTVRRTRFGNLKDRQAPALSNRLSDRSGNTSMSYEVAGDNSTVGRQKMKSVAHGLSSHRMPNKQAQQCYVLPDVSELSELVSGVQQDGSQIISRQGKSGPSRFVSAADSRSVSKSQSEHTDVENLAVLPDEKAIIQSLRHLQDRVTDLEYKKGDELKTMEGLKYENSTLKAEIQDSERRKRGDSIFGLADGSDCGNTNSRSRGKVAVESARLDSTVKSLQHRLDSVECKAVASEALVQTIREERDSAENELSRAYQECGQLNMENRVLKEEKLDLESELAQFKRFYEHQAQQWSKTEISLSEDLKRAKDALVRSEQKFETYRLGNEINESTQRTREDLADSLRPRPSSRGKDKRASEPHSFQSDFRFVSGESGPIRSTSDIRDSLAIRKALEESTNQLGVDSDWSQGTVQRHVIPEGNSRTEDLTDGQVRGGETPHHSANTTQDFTNLSFVDPRDVAKLRKNLEVERVDGTQDLTTDAVDHGREDTVKSSFSVEASSAKTAPGLPRKSSLKRASGRSSSQHDGKTEQSTVAANHTEEIIRASNTQSRTETGHKRNTSYTKPPASYAQQQPEESQLSNATVRRRRPAAEELTSAFILPDITLEKVPVQALEPADPDRERFNAVSKRLAEALARHRAKEAAEVPKSKPVSEEMLESFQDKEVPTTRSSYALNDGNSFHDVKNQSVQVSNPMSVSKRTFENHSYEDESIHHPSQPRVDSRASYTSARQSAMAARPASASERMNETYQYEDGPTLRPSQPPGVALATVMKSLKAELKDIKRELAQKQRLYYQQDPALGKRKRYLLREAIEDLLKVVDAKSDHIYALQDVLEGQKAAGQAMTQEDVEVTLQSIGIDWDLSGFRED